MERGIKENLTQKLLQKEMVHNIYLDYSERVL